jgi:hypothetical protein
MEMLSTPTNIDTYDITEEMTKSNFEGNSCVSSSKTKMNKTRTSAFITL